MEACQKAIATQGWRVLSHTDTSIVCKEVSPTVTSFTFAAQVAISVRASQEANTSISKITLEGSIFGFGPIQSGHLRGQVGALKNNIKLAANPSPAPSGSSIAEEILELNQLREQGLLSDDEFALAKAKLLK